MFTDGSRVDARELIRLRQYSNGGACSLAINEPFLSQRQAALCLGHPAHRCPGRTTPRRYRVDPPLHSVPVLSPASSHISSKLSILCLYCPSCSPPPRARAPDPPSAVPNEAPLPRPHPRHDPLARLRLAVQVKQMQEEPNMDETHLPSQRPRQHEPRPERPPIPIQLAPQLHEGPRSAPPPQVLRVAAPARRKGSGGC